MLCRIVLAVVIVLRIFGIFLLYIFYKRFISFLGFVLIISIRSREHFLELIFLPSTTTTTTSKSEPRIVRVPSFGRRRWLICILLFPHCSFVLSVEKLPRGFLRRLCDLFGCLPVIVAVAVRWFGYLPFLIVVAAGTLVVPILLVGGFFFWPATIFHQRSLFDSTSSCWQCQLYCLLRLKQTRVVGILAASSQQTLRQELVGSF
mmetsp:Transcript_7279/g.16448  ORF Transcript_7279/g.16448 Transcript_7279/m.16448 type:complete len:204 (-) Transcript_7279:153-764(-)